VPPTKTREQYSKRVEFVAKDDAEQTATGIVMVPEKVDLQGDFARQSTIEGFAQQFAALEDVGDAGGGVMHAVWPDEWIGLEDNRVLEEATEVGGSTAQAGAWVQEWRFDDDELWSLVDDAILEGYSIGAVDVEWSGSMSAEELPDDVDVAADYPDDGPFWELRDGIIREVSAVDIPAVPDAMILETKADWEKRLADYLGNRDGFMSEATDRGHSEEEAERLWEVLNRATELDGAGEPGKESVAARVGQKVLGAVFGSDDGADASKSPEAPDAPKESRTLSQANRERLMASHDAIEDALASDLEFISNRFTDDPTTDFDVADYDGKAAATTDTGGETPDSTDKNMGDDPDDTPPPEKNEERLDSIESKIDDLAEKVTEDDPDDADKEVDSDVAERLEEIEGKLDALAEASGKSQQLGGGDGGENDGPTKADILGIPGGD